MKKFLFTFCTIMGISVLLSLEFQNPLAYSRFFNKLVTYFSEHTDMDKANAVNDKIGSAAIKIKTAAEKLEPLKEPIIKLKADYLPMNGSGQLVDSETSQDATNPPTSNTGETYTFDVNLYPYFYMLKENQKSVYKQVYANAIVLNSSAFSPCVTLASKEIDNVMSAVYNDHPELFWLDTRYSYSYTPQGTIRAITLVFNTTIHSIENAKADFDSIVQTVLANTSNLSSELEKEKYVHDYLSDLISYNDTADMNQSAYSALVNGSSVCAGYSRAFQHLMIELDIPCYYCTGTANGENHAWNIVKLDDSYYNVDLSWDDSLSTAYRNYNYDYFNLPDYAFLTDHTRTGLSVNLPACEGTTMNFTNSAGNIIADHFYKTSYVSYEELGYTEDDILQNLSDYNAQCTSLLIQAGTGEHTFSYLIANEALLQNIYSETQNQEYVNDYVKIAAARLGLASCNVSVKLQAKQLADGFILLQQTISLTEDPAKSTNP